MSDLQAAKQLLKSAIETDDTELIEMANTILAKIKKPVKISCRQLKNQKLKTLKEMVFALRLMRCQKERMNFMMTAQRRKILSLQTFSPLKEKEDPTNQLNKHALDVVKPKK
mgnify:CR=1 FL=1